MARDETLVGRTRELAWIRDFLAGDGAALLLSGEAGVGKSVLLDAVTRAAAADGLQVLRADGVEFEADMAFAGLNQLLLPIMEAADGLDAPYREALNVAVGLGDGLSPGRMAVSNAVLTLLRTVAVERPVLLAIDDLPWIDRASVAVLGFVARRLSGTRVGIISASRTGSEGLFPCGNMREYELSPLDDDAARLLVGARFPGLAASVRQRVLEEARGNALALLELPAALTGPQRTAQTSLPEVLPLTDRLRALYASRITGLSDACRRLLLLAALDGTGDLAVLQSADPSREMRDLAEAERDQLVHVDESRGRLAFRHPLIRAAVVDVSTSVDRRAAHAALAGVLESQPDRLAWHLAEAVLRPDEHVAELLEHTAHRMLRRGDAVGAVVALTKAAHISPEGPGRSRRLAEAAYISAEGAGVLTHASELLADARRADLDGPGQLHAAIAAVYLLMNDDGSMDTAYRLLVDAIQAGPDDAALADALSALLLVCWWSGREDHWRSFTAAVEQRRAELPAVLRVEALTFPDPARTGKLALADIDELVEAARDETDPAAIVRIGVALFYLDRVGDVRDAIWRIVRHGRDGGQPRRRLTALMFLCLDHYLAGEWSEVGRLAEEGIAVCDSSGYRFFRWYFDYVNLLLYGVRGDTATAFTLAERIVRWATPRGARTSVHYANQARTVVCLGSGDYERAYQYATAVSPAGELASHVPHAMWGAMDLVEAAVRTGRHAEAAAHVRALQEADIAALSPRFALMVAGATALCADDDEALRLYEEALSVPDVERWPFEVARVRLAYGERLRRTRAIVDARSPLSDALTTFEWLGARPWVLRAQQELRASGWSDASKPDDPRLGTLTPQELEVAQLAASGLTNKQIAERLFLSHRTVGAHLYQIFPKLGITSRAALRDALQAVG
ncbi:AAA family ATPase [Kutzneria buriramensis]|uniref:Regulatory LuxR family protein n=1 Tax=Kutzneria buriramensis TaxID=1045776 RepID=A0A3E0HDE2_9PSEU|nr:LuxR family transcriptional regulator [Kutzneria buriramensis]REH42806.1 regulatory LuxR family protein [Kutzneria buriramensis]